MALKQILFKQQMLANLFFYKIPPKIFILSFLQY